MTHYVEALVYSWLNSKLRKCNLKFGHDMKFYFSHLTRLPTSLDSLLLALKGGTQISLSLSLYSVFPGLLGQFTSATWPSRKSVTRPRDPKRFGHAAWPVQAVNTQLLKPLISLVLHNTQLHCFGDRVIAVFLYLLFSQPILWGLVKSCVALQSKGLGKNFATINMRK